MRRQSSPPQRRGVRRNLMGIAVIILCACSPTVVLAQWTQPDASGNINSTNTGNVGIGTTTPSAKLTVSNNTQTVPAGQAGTAAHIAGANGSVVRLLVDGFGAVTPSIDMRRANNTALSPTALLNGDGIGQITWQGRGGTSYNGASRAKISVFAAENYTDTAQGAFMTFAVAPQGGITAAEAMRIDASGSVGIGTTAPGFKLDVNGNVGFRGGATYFKQSSGLAGNEGAAIGIGATVNNEATFALSVYRAGVYTNRILVNQFGHLILQPNNDLNVGIGVASPGYKFDVSGQINASTGLCIAGDCKTAWSQVGGASQWSLNGTSLYYNGGHVGVGTTTPVFDGNAGAKYLTVAAGTNTAGSIGAGGGTANTGTAVGQFAFVNTALGTTEKRLATIVGSTDTATNSGVIDFYMANAGVFTAPKMRINSGGNVGIGTTTPGGLLSVVGTSAAASSVEAHILNNTASGYSSLRVGVDAVAGTGAALHYFNGSWATSGADIANGAELISFGSGGLTVAARHASGAINFFTGGGASGNQRVTITPAGNVGIGTASPSTPLHVVGDVTVTGNIAARYQDIAEWVESSSHVLPGTVVVLDPSTSNRVMASSRPYDTRVAGVVSAQPGLMLGERGDNKVLVATTGRVKVKVDATAGPIEVGDLLVTSDQPGVAMKSKPIDVGGVQIHRPGTLVGKALEPLPKGTGEILVLLSLQ